MKRILGFILAFLVLAFSVIPCADDASINDGTKVEFSQSVPNDNDQDHTDACSPFCICSCCAGFSVVTKLPNTPQPVIAFRTAQTSYISERLFSIALPIWQPPQLV